MLTVKLTVQLPTASLAVLDCTGCQLIYSWHECIDQGVLVKADALHNITIDGSHWLMASVADGKGSPLKWQLHELLAWMKSE